MASAITERLNSLLSSGLFATKRALAQAAGINEVTLNDNLKRTEPRFSTLEAILKACPSVSAEWLMRGEGEMFRTAHLTAGGNNIIKIDKSNRTVSNGGTIGDGNGAATELVDQLRKENERLSEQIRTKDEQIATLLSLMNK